VQPTCTSIVAEVRAASFSAGVGLLLKSAQVSGRFADHASTSGASAGAGGVDVKAAKSGSRKEIKESGKPWNIGRAGGLFRAKNNCWDKNAAEQV
jgi:hypothetical protein